MLKKIMLIKLKIGLSVLVFLLLVQVISAYFFGILAKEELDLQFKHLANSPFVKVLSRSYSRSWFHSQETVSLELNSQTIKNIFKLIPGLKLKESNFQLKLDYVNNISSGLFAGWLNGSPMLTLAVSKTNFHYSPELKSVLDKFFNNQVALELTNYIYLNKAGKYQLSSPKFNYSEAISGVKVLWDGAYLKIKYNPKFDHFQSKLLTPGLFISGPTIGQLGVNNISYISDSSYSINKIKVGTTDLKLNEIYVNLIESQVNLQVKLGDILNYFTGINSVNFLNSIDSINPLNFKLHNLSYNSLSYDESGYFSASAKAGFESLISNQSTYGPMNLDLNLKHIKSPEFSKLLDDLSSYSTLDASNNESYNAMLEELISSMEPILVDKPVIELQDFKLKTPNGNIVLNGFATTNNFESSDIDSQERFIKKIKLKLYFSLPKSVMEYYFLLQMKYFLTAGNAKMDAQSEAALSKLVNILFNNQLQTWLKKKYLVESQGFLSSQLQIESGIISLNGIKTN